MIFGIFFVASAVLLVVFRKQIVKVEAWFHREAPGGGGERVARYATVRGVLLTALVAASIGVYSILESTGVIP